MRPTRSLAVLGALALASVCHGQAASTSRPAAKPAGPYDKIVTIGASLTHGFANGMPLANQLQSAIAVEHRRVERASSSMFFLTPIRTGAAQIRRAKRLKATCVVAMDFLFWYCYGPSSRLRGALEKSGVADEEVAKIRSGRNVDLALRQATLERGLAELAKLDVPVLVGDLPDMTGASPMMLPPHHIPKRSILDALNRRIVAWAKTRKHVRLVDLAARVRSMKAGTMKIPAADDAPAIPLTAKQVLSGDALHPSKLGVIVFCGQLVDELRAWHPRYAKALRYDVRKGLRARGFGDVLDAESQSRPAGGKANGKR